jgi:dephospho-CoA kinase
VAVPFVGLTGGLGAGKSTALVELESLGAAVLSADAVVHELYREPAVAAAVRARFGGEIFDASDEVDRGALAARVFGREDDRAWLERLLWPLVARRTEDFYAQASRRDPPPRAVVLEAPLLFEGGGDSRYSATIAVIADDAIRVQRLAARGQSQLAEREARQLPQVEKARRASHVIVNDGTVEELRAQLAAVLEKIAC